MRKETVDIDILETSRNSYRKIMQSIKIASRPPLRIRKWNQSNTYRKDISWLHFDDKPRVQERQQSGKQDPFRRILKSSATMYESSGSQFFRPPLEYNQDQMPLMSQGSLQLF